MESDSSYVPTILTLGFQHHWEPETDVEDYARKYAYQVVVTHVIIDGHHKLAVAAKLDRPVTVLGFFHANPFRYTPKSQPDDQNREQQALGIVLDALVNDYEPKRPLSPVAMVKNFFIVVSKRASEKIVRRKVREVRA